MVLFAFYLRGRATRWLMPFSKSLGGREVRDELVARGHDYVEGNGWHRKKYEYLNLIDSLSTVEFPPSVCKSSFLQGAIDCVVTAQRN